MARGVPDNVRRQVEADLVKGVRHKEISATRGVSIGYVSKVRGKMKNLPERAPETNRKIAALIKKLARLQRPVMHEGYCKRCYWGKNTGSKITCFWQECKKGWPV